MGLLWYKTSKYTHEKELAKFLLLKTKFERIELMSHF